MPRSEVVLASADSSNQTFLTHEKVPVLPWLTDTKSWAQQSLRHGSLSTALLESQEMTLACPSEPRTSERQDRMDQDASPTESIRDTASCGEVDAHNVVGSQNEIRSGDRSPSISVPLDSLVEDAPLSPGDLHVYHDTISASRECVVPTNAGLVLNAPDGDKTHRPARDVGTQTLMKSGMHAYSGTLMPRCWKCPAQPLHKLSLVEEDCTTSWSSLDHQMELARDRTERGPRMAPISTHGGQLQQAQCTVA
ncbi:hypothetical protein FGB62_56g19 [Gracilaria domingensis]|nr:hypothetical protein FGB62_56g19 [Gracilaria domingensis]